jgi:hypothetical protein
MIYFNFLKILSVIPYVNTSKYLGMNLDAKLRWKEHIKKKRDELNMSISLEEFTEAQKFLSF